jgi:hypothetical protein
MEEAARIIAKAFGNCVTDRYVYASVRVYNVQMNLIGSHHPTSRANGVFTTSLVWFLNVISGQVFSIHKPSEDSQPIR